MRNYRRKLIGYTKVYLVVLVYIRVYKANVLNTKINKSTSYNF